MTPRFSGKRIQPSLFQFKTGLQWRVGFALIFSLLSSLVNADPLSTTSQPVKNTTNTLIPPAYQRIADKHQIDPALLFALAKTESGRNGAFGVGVMPWPWTANICDGKPGVRCKGYWFKDRKGLYTQLSRELKRGNSWFDVGQVQMNWHYHRQRFNGDLWAATHPLVNLNQAAGLVKELQQKHKNATDLFAAYHAGSAWKQKDLSNQRIRQIQQYAAKTLQHYQKMRKGLGGNA